MFSRGGGVIVGRKGSVGPSNGCSVGGINPSLYDVGRKRGEPPPRRARACDFDLDPPYANRLGGEAAPESLEDLISTSFFYLIFCLTSATTFEK